MDEGVPDRFAHDGEDFVGGRVVQYERRAAG